MMNRHVTMDILLERSGFELTTSGVYHLCAFTWDSILYHSVNRAHTLMLYKRDLNYSTLVSIYSIPWKYTIGVELMIC